MCGRVARRRVRTRPRRPPSGSRNLPDTSAWSAHHRSTSTPSSNRHRASTTGRRWHRTPLPRPVPAHHHRALVAARLGRHRIVEPVHHSASPPPGYPRHQTPSSKRPFDRPPRRTSRTKRNKGLRSSGLGLPATGARYWLASAAAAASTHGAVSNGQKSESPPKCRHDPPELTRSRPGPKLSFSAASSGEGHWYAET